MIERMTIVPLVGRRAEIERIAGLAAEAGTGAVLLSGPAGIGKSRLAEEALAELANRGWNTLVLSATQSTAHIPYGALSGIIPDALDRLGSVADPERVVLRAVEDALDVDGRRAAGVLIDGVASLDEPTSAVLMHLAINRRLFVIGTETAGPRLIEASRRLSPAGTVEIAVPSLTAAETADLAVAVLGGPVDTGLARNLQTLTEGFPLFVVDVTRWAASEGLIARQQDIHRLTGALKIPPSLGRQIVFRLGLVDQAERDALELLAVGGELDVEDLASRVGHPVLESMERRALVTTSDHEDGVRVALRHPLTGKALAADMTPLVRRRRCVELVALLQQREAPSERDRMILSLSRIGAGTTPDADELLAAATTALTLDRIRDAERLTAVAFRSEPSERTHTAHAEALVRLGRFVEADALLAEPLPPTSSEWEHMRRAIRRSSNQLWGFGDADAARQVDLDCARLMTEGAVINRITAHRAWIEFSDGWPERALHMLGPLQEERHPDVRFAVYSAWAPATVMVGRVTEGARLAQRAWDNGWGADTEFGSLGQHLIALGFGLLYQGQIDAARFVTDQAIEHCRARSEMTPLLFFLDLAGSSELMVGNLEAACSLFIEASELASQLSLSSALRSALAGLATCLAQMGRPDELQRIQGRLRSVPVAPGPRGGADVMVAEAWATSLEGDPAEAAQLFRGAVESASGRGATVPAVLALFDLARIGRATPEDGIQAADLADGCEGELLPALASGVAASAARDGEGLDRVGLALRELGFPLWSAEMSAQATEAWSSRGVQRAATASRRASAQARDEAGPARTPSLATARPDSAVVEPLTRREREVTALAAAGKSNGEIAEQLHLSVRTVETHLARVYRKLGLSGRSEL